MKRTKNGQEILKSAKRLAEGEEEYSKRGNGYWLWFLKKESTILLRRVISLWIKLRFGGLK